MWRQKTPFESLLEVGLRAIDLELGDSEETSEALALNHYGFYDYVLQQDSAQQYVQMRRRRLQTENVLVEHGVALPESGASQAELYELLDVWTVLPENTGSSLDRAAGIMRRFEIVAKTNDWYVETENERKREEQIKLEQTFKVEDSPLEERQQYDPGKMVQRTIYAIQGKLKLPHRLCHIRWEKVRDAFKKSPIGK